MTNETLTERIIGIPSRMVVPYVIPALIKELDFFNRFNQIGCANLETLSHEFGLDQRILGATMHYLVKEGFVQKDFNSYSLSSDTKNLLTSSGEYNLTPFVRILETTLPNNIEKAIVRALQTGKPIEWTEGKPWAEVMKSGAIAKQFSDGMMARGNLLSGALSKCLQADLERASKVLDIGGSLGDYCGRFTNDYSNLECTIFDLPSVGIYAKDNIQKKAYKRVSVISGDFFAENLPTGYDVHLLSNVIHDWPMEKSREILGKSYNSLMRGGKLFIHGLHLDDDLNNPVVAIDHSLYLALMTEGRCYTYGEISKLMRETGFEKIYSRKTIGGYGVVIGEKKELTLIQSRLREKYEVV